MTSEPLFDARRLLALALVSAGAEMTVTADELVTQDEWDALFNEGFLVQRRPLHGEPYAYFTEKGSAEYRRLREGWNRQEGEA